MTEIHSSLGGRIGALKAVLDAMPLWPVQTIARISVGWVFYNSAMLKLQSWFTTLLLFRDEYRLPFLPFEFAAQLATAIELSGSVLLLVGFMSRLATLPLLGTIAVIQIFVYPNAWAEHLTWTALLLMVLLRGPGPISLDYLAGRIFCRPEVRSAGA